MIDIFQPQDYDVSSVDRFLKNETSEIQIKLKSLDRNQCAEVSITNVELRLYLIKRGNPHEVVVKAFDVDRRNPEAAVISFSIDEESVGVEDCRAIRRCRDRFNLLGASRLVFDVVDGSETKKYSYEFCLSSGFLSSFCWKRLD